MPFASRADVINSKSEIEEQILNYYRIEAYRPYNFEDQLTDDSIFKYYENPLNGHLKNEVSPTPVLIPVLILLSIWAGTYLYHFQASGAGKNTKIVSSSTLHPDNDVDRSD